MTFSADEIRSHFPSVATGDVFFDGPGGTQVPQQVIDALVHYYQTSNSNTHGPFATSRRTDAVISEGRAALADFLNAPSPDEIVFGPNMTTLTFNLSRAIGRTLNPGDEIILTRLDHDADISPWLALEERGAVVKWIDIHPEDCTLNLADLERQLSRKTRIVAVGGASNAVGTINDVATIVKRAHAAGALVFADAVHLAPHVPIDVQALDCDFLACSVYKFYGPHLGVLYGKRELLEHLPAYKVRPAPNGPPDKFETGTQNHEAIAGACAAVDYLAWLGATFGQPLADRFGSFQGRRLHLKTAVATIQAYERNLFTGLMEGLKEIPAITIYGITDSARFDSRTPTVAFNIQGHTPQAVAKTLGEEGIYVWEGNYYAPVLMERLGLEEHGGAVRVGLAHYNTAAEVDRFLQVMRKHYG